MTRNLPGFTMEAPSPRLSRQAGAGRIVGRLVMYPYTIHTI